ncbi:hypothetical protein GCK32_021144, partial [Trichostrongylus colubriformis]
GRMLCGKLPVQVNSPSNRMKSPRFVSRAVHNNHQPMEYMSLMGRMW